MKNSKSLWMVVGLLNLSMCLPAPASASSKYLNVQGRLVDSSGAPLTGSQTITFRLYTSSTASVGSAIWTESQAVTLSSGLFNVTLGTVTALDGLSFLQPYFLGIQVAGDADEQSPRQVLGASAYAQASLGDFNVGGNLGVAGSVTASSLTLSGNAGVLGNATIAGNSLISGYASISGQEIVAGSATVQGNAFSVGSSTLVASGGNVGIRTSNPAAPLDVVGAAQFGSGALKSTFTATPGAATYALTASSGVKILNGGLLTLTSGGLVQWADGSTSTTASHGDFVNAGNNVVSGANTSAGSWTSTLQSTTTIFGNTNIEILIASRVFTNPAVGIATITFSTADLAGLATDFGMATWRVHFNLISTNAVHYMLYFNDDLAKQTNSNYRGGSFTNWGGGVTTLNFTAPAALLNGNAYGYQILANEANIGDFEFEQVWAASTTVAAVAYTHPTAWCCNPGDYAGNHSIGTVVRNMSRPVTSFSIFTNKTVDSTAVPPNTNGMISQGYVELWLKSSRRR
ncbi:MAG: hypothetical protein HY925_02585 [Elusimicrobia bacterium]|nr:hypothetical protein [Elusimicrobiota bacterium]